jgi:hypothetical protein
VSPGTIALIFIAAGIAVWVLFMANLTIRRNRRAAVAGSAVEHTSRTDEPEPNPASPMRAQAASEGASAAAAQPGVTVRKVPEKQRKPLTPDQLAVSRRQFLNRAWTASFITFLGLFGMSSLSFLWPKLTGGFGTKITAGNHEDLLAEIGPQNNYIPKFVAEGRFWLSYY